MNKVGPAIFFFALLACAAPFVSQGFGVIIFFIAWGVYGLRHRRCSGLFFTALGAVELWPLISSIC